MAKKFHYTQIGKRKLKLSNLEKFIYPEDGIVKAEVIQYYLQIAPTILRHIKRRPLSLIRFPDGVANGTKPFFQKDKPDWTPDWVESVPLGSGEKKEYIMATEEASLVMLANLAALELHPMPLRHPNFEHPDYFVFDIDPPNDQSFVKAREICFKIKTLLEAHEYHPFVKTSGGKGLHIYVPILAKWTIDEVFNTIKPLAEIFVKENKKTCTLNIKKDARKGKFLIDIYRNRSAQTVIAPYSLRGRLGAPVSMPLSWERMASVEDPKEFNIRNVVDYIVEHGDAWEGFGSFAVPLHDKKTKTKTSKTKTTKSKFHKTPEQLEDYTKKRDFDKTTEPKPKKKGGNENNFVIHRHHATRLHYDLRIESEGSLRSFAIPKGMPQRPGIKRLAIETEPHPIEYLDFEGEIPKGEYGGGKMWQFANGRYNITKQKKDGFYFHLSSKELDGEFRMHNIKGKEWLLERVDRPQVDINLFNIKHMLAGASAKIPRNGDYIYEVKWDGIRTMITLDEGEVKIQSRSLRDITSQFPELQDASKAFRASSAIFDAEIVCLDAKGRPDFKNVISRLHNASKAKIERAVSNNPVYCYVFDCLYLDGRFIHNEPLHRRQAWLADSLKKGTHYRASEAIDDGKALYAAAKEMNLEGIMAKKRNSTYGINKRSDDWLKIKFRTTADCIIIGYTAGQGDRAPYFGALHLGRIEENKMIYLGKVGTGFDHAKVKSLRKLFDTLKNVKKPFHQTTPDDRNSTWLEPVLYCEINYASITDNGTYREPVFMHLRPDLS